jgi:3-(3-hydroxy-phenyl)propionate hydroxylase
VLALVCREPGTAAYVTVVDDHDGALPGAWGAERGEVFVVRPDGLLLARGRADDLVDLPQHVLAGGVAVETEAGPADAVVAVAADEERRESAWMALSDGINAVPSDDREGFLARLALLLGDQVPTDDFAQAVTTAAAVR